MLISLLHIEMIVCECAREREREREKVRERMRERDRERQRDDFFEKNPF